MAKPGEKYQQIVNALVQALDPNATVRVGQWIHGPDGQREVDVEIRGCVDDNGHFTLVECKDWRRPVDIQEIDKFHHHALGKLVELSPAELYLRVNAREQAKSPHITKLSNLSLDGLSIACWAQEEIREVVSREEEGGSLVLTYGFSSPPLLTVDGKPISVTGLVLVAQWQVKWLSQIINAEVTKASFDHIRKRTTLPGFASLTLGPIDTYSSGWSELPERPEEWRYPPPPHGMSLRFGFLKGFVPECEPHEVPNLARYVQTREIELRSAG